MPYTNIYYVKVKIELLNDKRFIFDLNATEKWLFLGLLMLAGSTNNKIPDDPDFLINRLRLQKSDWEGETTQKISDLVRVTTNRLLSIFPGLYRSGHFLKFKSFSRLHNQVRDSQRIAKGKPMGSVDKIRLDKIIQTLAIAKGWLIDKDPSLQTEVFKRHCKPAKQLLLAVGSDVDRACQIIQRAAKFFKEKDWQWTLETVLKYLPEFSKQTVKKDEYL